MEHDKMAISQGNNHHPQTEAPLCQRTNGWSALYGTSPHAIWSIVSCGHFVSCPATQKPEEWKKHLSMCRSSCHRLPEGKYFELVNWLPESDGRYYSHWQKRVSRGRRGGVQNELRPGSLWHQRIADIILLLYPVCCSGLGEVWADLRGSGQNWCAALHLHMRFFFIEWMAAAGNFMIVSTGVAPENALRMKAVASGIEVHWCCSRLCSGLKPVIFL